MKLKFVIDKKYDKEIARAMNFPEVLLKKIDSQYKISLFALENAKKLYQKSWNEIGREFSDYIEKETGYNWFYPKYECVVSIVHFGVSNWGDGPKIVRHWRENAYWMRRMTAHELIISHYFEIHKRHYSDEGLSDGQIWALAEIAAYALTSLKKVVKKWWPWDSEYRINNSYSQIIEIQNKLELIFLKSKNFDEYIREGIKIIKKYPEISPVRK